MLSLPPGLCEYDFHKHFHFMGPSERVFELKACFFNGFVVV
jgi:hypothetical protein